MPSLKLRLLALAGTLLATRAIRAARAGSGDEAGLPKHVVAEPGAAFPWGTVAGLLAAAALVTAAALGWQAWKSQAQAVAVAKAITRGDPALGPALITRYGCGGCHTIPGAPGADGKVAGPLGGMRARVYVGGVARHDAETLIRWIVAPQSISPRSAMPATGITEEEARHVAAFLYTR